MGVVSSLFVSAGLLALTALAAHVAGPLPEELASFLRVYPWITLALGVLLGLRFRRGRVVFAVAVIALADRMLLRFGLGAGGEDAARWTLAATACLLPLNLAWLALARERGTLNPSGFLRMCAIAAQPALVSFAWLSCQPRLVSLSVRRFLPLGIGSALRIPDAAFTAFVVSAGAVTVSCLVRRKALEVGFLGAIVASFLAFEFGPSVTLYLATGELILVVALLESTFAMAFRDSLTGLPSRRAFDEAVEKLAGAYAVAMVDVDHFKDVNDRHGHDVGDQVLRMIAARLEAEGGGARAYRVGGEEFALVYTNRSRDEVLVELERLRAGIAESGFALRAPDRPKRKPKGKARREDPIPTIGVTVSIGVAERGGRLATPTLVLRAADAALYRAKGEGRNRVCV